jgi:copper transporter 1
MDHGDMGHGGMGHGDMCSMSMLFTWDTTNLCIVFKQWHVRTTPGLIFSLLAVVALGAGYEALREASRRYEIAVNKRLDTIPSCCDGPRGNPDDEPATETTPFLWTGRNQPAVNKRAHLIKAVLYGIQNFYAFMLMLVFMTYNGWVMIAVSLGAFLGYLLFGNSTSSTKDNACH